MHSDPMSHEEFFKLSPNDAREHLLRRSHPDDNLPAQITNGQLLRVQQIVSEALNSGVDATREQLPAAEMFLTAVLTAGGSLREHTNLDPRAKWNALDRLRIVSE